MVMRVDSSITLDPDGSLAEFTIANDLPSTLRKTLEKEVRQWHFKPVLVAGEARRVRTDMRVILAARETGEGFRIKIDNVLFPGKDGVNPDAAVAKAPPMSGKSLSPPRYPIGLARANVRGMVLLTVRVGAEGQAEAVVATQSMVYDVRGRPDVLATALEQFEKAAVAAAQRWKFTISAERAALPASERTVSVPVEYLGDGRRTETVSGVWRTVVRVPRREVEWLRKEQGIQWVGVSDLSAGEMMPLASAFGFSTPVVGNQL